MRGTLLWVLILALLVVACGDNSVVGPDGTTTTQAEIIGTTSTSMATTTTVDSTPTTVVSEEGDFDLAAGADACVAGDDVACDLLFLLSNIGTQEAAIGEDCGGREGSGGFGCSGYDPDTSTAFTYGDDPLLDALWDMCALGNGMACAQLYAGSPDDSEYQIFGENFGSLQNSIAWTTEWVSLEADDFRLVADGIEFLGAGDVDVRSSAPESGHMEFKVEWQENGVEMRLIMDFEAVGDVWHCSSMITRDGQEDWDNIWYTGPFFESPLGEAFTGTVTLESDPASEAYPYSGEVRFVNLRLLPGFPEVAPAVDPTS